MLVFVSISLLLVGALVLMALRLFRPAFTYHWLIAVSAAILAWGIALFAWPADTVNPTEPLSFPLGIWEPQEFFPISPLFVLDQVSWAFVIGLVSLTASAILTGVVRPVDAERTEPGWLTWSTVLVITTAGIGVVLAGNLLTVLLAWVALDLIELLAWLARAQNPQQNERVILGLSTRVAGIIVGFWAGITASRAGLPMDFANMLPQTGGYLLAASSIRLGAIPLSVAFPRDIPINRSLLAILRLVPAGASLSLLPRIAQAGVPTAAIPYWLGLIALPAIFGSIFWLISKDELSGQPYWILGAAALALASVVRQQPGACLAWSLAALFSGGSIFLFSLREWRLAFMVTGTGLIGFSAFPFTPAWYGSGLYTLPLFWTMPIYLIAQCLLLAGLVRHASRKDPAPPLAERWIWLIYPGGLALLLLTHLWLGWRIWFSQPGLLGIQSIRQTAPGWLASVTVMVCIGLSQVLLQVLRHKVKLRVDFANRPLTIVWKILSFEWAYLLLWRGYLFLRSGLLALSSILEGPAGILWALLLLILLASLFARI